MVGETVWLPRMDWLAGEPVTVSHVIYIVLFLVSCFLNGGVED